MNCPNCITTFVLRADYADHVRQCRPVDTGVAVSDALLARLNAAAARLHAEFGDVPPNRLAQRLDSAA
jgi:hypothetical protein